MSLALRHGRTRRTRWLTVRIRLYKGLLVVGGESCTFASPLRSLQPSPVHPDRIRQYVLRVTHEHEGPRAELPSQAEVSYRPDP